MQIQRPKTSYLLLSLSLGVVACGGDDTTTMLGLAPAAGDETPSPGDAPADAPEPGTGAKYVVSSAVFDPDGSTTTLINVLDSLDVQTLDYDVAVELAGWADVWVHEGYVYVSDGEAPTITRYTLADDGRLEPGPSLSFAAYGLIESAFWNNTFVAPDKGYMINGVTEYVIWDPIRMQVTGTLPLPEIGERSGLLVRAGTTDRSNVIRDGLLYQPMYWSDEDYAVFADDSRIAVFDIAGDRLVDVLDAPCSGLDVGTRDAAGNLYFSTWTGGVLGPFIFDAPQNCVATIPAGQDVASLGFRFADVTNGREGAAARELGDGKLMLSVFHDERVDFETEEDPWAALAANNWRAWVYDPKSGIATPSESIGWNSGATYLFHVDEQPVLLVPGLDYETTSLYVLDERLFASPRFDTRGWATRVFRAR
jgi:hypothetical protein